MKKTIMLSAVALMLAIFATSCTKELFFDYTIEDHDTHVKASLYTGTYTDTFTVKQQDLKAAFTAAKATFDMKKIKSMVAKGFKIKSKGATNLDGVKGVSLFIQLANSPVERKQIASTAVSPAAGATEYEMVINGTDLKDMLGDTDLWIIAEVYYDNPSDKYITVTKGTMTFNVKN